MNRVFCLLVGSLLSLASLSPATAERPNIILIVADDLGFGDLGCYGQKQIQTPHLDQLAAEGMRFTDFYAGSTVCRPSRLVYLTGYHCGHTPISSNARYDLKPADTTMAGLMKKAGYATGGVGKWALGNIGSTGHPNKQGFDFWYGYLDQSEAHNYYPEVLYRNDQAEVQPGNKVGEHRRVSVKRETYSHDQMTKEALGFIRRHHQQAFFLNIAWTIPHANNERGNQLGDDMEVPNYGRYADETWPDVEKGFAAMISRMDADVGKIISLLKELEIADRTLVLFTSDNGPHNEGGHKHTFFNSNGDLKGFKRDLYDGGIRVPLIAWMPGRVKAGLVSDHLGMFCDLMPTFCDLGETKLPAGVDGISFAPTLQGGKQLKHDYLFWKDQSKTAVRQGQWKGVRTKKQGPLELYDLSKDIGEDRNIAGEHPQQAAKLERLIERAQVQNVEIQIMRGGWGEANPATVRRVLQEATLPLLRQFPGLRLDPIRVAAKGGPIVLYRRGDHGEYYVRLDTGDLFWAQYIYQFAHELGHILCRYEEDQNGNRWFEESLCELASLYTLRRLSEKWRDDSPYDHWDFDKNLKAYADERMAPATLPEEVSLHDWYASHANELRASSVNRELNTVAAVALLPMFEASPEHWQAVAWLNDGKDIGALSFADYLTQWRDRCPPAHRRFVGKIAKEFGVTLDSESRE